MKKKILGMYVLAYLLWVVSLIFALGLLILIRNILPPLISTTLLNNPGHAVILNVFVDRAFILLGGIAWLVWMAVVEQYLRKGVKRGTLWPRAARVIGGLLLALGVAEALQIVFLGSRAWPGGSAWLLALAELAAGAALTRFSRRRAA